MLGWLILLAVVLVVGIAVRQFQARRVDPAFSRRLARPGEAAAATETMAFGGSGIPGFDILESLGSGGMAHVYKARRQRDGKTVALKLLDETSLSDPDSISRFHHEAEVARRIRHPSVVETLDHGSVGTQHYLVLAFVEGTSLDAMLEAGPLPAAGFYGVATALADALRAIHRAGFLHRDVKPSNVMIRRPTAVRTGEPMQASEVTLVDFGIAGTTMPTRISASSASWGTPTYRSPEQLQGDTSNPASDTYALGVVLYELATGAPAFEGTHEAVEHQHRFRTPAAPQLAAPWLPSILSDLILAMLAKDPRQRPSLDQVVTTLEQAAVVPQGQMLDHATRLLVVVQEHQGTVRWMNAGGGLLEVVADVGPGHTSGHVTGNLSGHLPGIPVAADVGPSGQVALLFSGHVLRPGDPAVHVLTGESATRHMAPIAEHGLERPVDLAIGHHDEVFVVDAVQSCVHAWRRDGAYLGRVVGSGDHEGALRDPRQLALDGEGRLHVLDVERREVQRFAVDGRYDMSWAFRVDGGSGERRPLLGMTVRADGALYLVDGTANRIRVVHPDGTLVATEPLALHPGEPTDTLWLLSVDEDGSCFAVRQGGRMIQRFTVSGEHAGVVAAAAPVRAIRAV